MTAGPKRDAENEANKELSAFPLDDVHGYISLGRRISNVATFLGVVALVVFGCYLLWKVNHG